MNQYDGRRGSAIHTLCYYLKTAFEASGLQWDSDNDAEVEAIVDAIVEEALSQIKKEERDG